MVEKGKSRAMNTSSSENQVSTLEALSDARRAGGNIWQRILYMFGSSHSDREDLINIFTSMLVPIEKKLDDLQDLLQQNSATPRWQSSIDNNSISVLSSHIQSVENRLTGLTNLFHTQLEGKKEQNGLFDKLYNNLVFYRDNFVFKYILERLFRELILIYDTLDETLNPATLQNLHREKLIFRLEMLRERISQMLAKQEVTLIEAEGKKFDRNYQEAIHTQATDTPEDDLKVIEVVKKGFRYKDQILRSEQVVISKYGKEGSS